jgi:hypothetical protein
MRNRSLRINTFTIAIRYKSVYSLAVYSHAPKYPNICVLIYSTTWEYKVLEYTILAEIKLNLIELNLSESWNELATPSHTFITQRSLAGYRSRTKIPSTVSIKGCAQSKFVSELSVDYRVDDLSVDSRAKWSDTSERRLSKVQLMKSYWSSDKLGRTKKRIDHVNGESQQFKVEVNFRKLLQEDEPEQKERTVLNIKNW